jgi:Na+/H+-dicarboxylate symporter
MRKMSFTTKVIVGLLSGILLGVFFGEHVAWLSVAGDVFIGLLQMTVLPYIVISLIVNIGRLSVDTGKRMVKFASVFLGLLLFLGMVYLFILPLSFPQWASGSFYSSDFVREVSQINIVKLYIPANIFESLSNNMVPAAVLFSIFVGLGIMKIPGKEQFLKPLEILNQALNKVNKMIVKLTPVGVFSIGAGVVSKLSWADLNRLQGYLIVYFIAVVLFTFVILPYIISIFTPFKPKTVFRITKSTLITIFATGKIIVVYPQLIANIKEILKTGDISNDEGAKETDILLPLAYPFPNLGTFMIYIFVPFAAWFTGKAMMAGDFPAFLGSTLLSSFVAPVTGLPFTLDTMHIQADTFNLFILSTVITDRIRVVLGAFHLITLALLTIAATQGVLRFKIKKFIEALIVISVLTTGSILGTNYILKKNIEGIPTNLEVLNGFHLITSPQPYTIEAQARKNPHRKWRGENVLSRIKRTGEIRIGFYRHAMPFAFFNTDSNLVGLGIDLAHNLAAELNAKIVFVPVTPGKLNYEINNDYYDIVVSDIFISGNYAQWMNLSDPYLNISLAMVVDKKSEEFNSFESTISLDTFTVSYFERGEIAGEFASFFPNAGIYPLNDPYDFFEKKLPDSINVDAYLTSAERGSALSMLFPGYKVVNPLPYHITNALVFPLAPDDVWRKFVNNWINFRTKDGTIDRIYDQWILGHEFKSVEKPWSIWDNVILKDNEVRQ